MIEKIKIFLRESKEEIKKVNWPTKKEIIRYTAFVIGLSLAVALFLGLLDFLFIQVLEMFVL